MRRKWAPKVAERIDEGHVLLSTFYTAKRPGQNIAKSKHPPPCVKTQPLMRNRRCASAQRSNHRGITAIRVGLSRLVEGRAGRTAKLVAAVCASTTKQSDTQPMMGKHQPFPRGTAASTINPTTLSHGNPYGRISGLLACLRGYV